MRIRDIHTQPPPLAPGANGYDFLAQAVRHLRWDHHEQLTSLFIPSFTSRRAPCRLNESDVLRMDEFVRRNRTVIELIDRSIACPEFVEPTMKGRDANAPEVADARSTMSRELDLALVCYLEARLLIRHRQWRGALAAIDRLFRFSSMLLAAWLDLGPSEGLVNNRACQAALEMSLQPAADDAIVLRSMRLVHADAVPAVASLDASTRPIWRIIAEFFETLDDRADALAVVRQVLADNAFRRALARSEFGTWDPEGVGTPPPPYPAVTDDDELELQGELPSVAVRWLSQQCADPFDKAETLDLLDSAIAAIEEQQARGPILFREYLDCVTSERFPTYRLASLLHAASNASAYEIQGLLSGLPFAEDGSEGDWLPRNVVGAALAADIISACWSYLSGALVAWQLWTLNYEFDRTALAMIAYWRSHGSLPRDLDELECLGYVESVPCDPFCGEPLQYDRQQRRLFVDARVSSVTRFGESPDYEIGETDEVSHYLHLPS